MSIKRLCSKHRVTIQQENEVRLAAGSVDRAPYTTLATKVPCFVQPASADDVMTYGTQHQETTHLVFFATDVGLDQTKTLLFGTRRLYVLSYKNVLELGRVWLAMVKELEEGAEP